MKKFNFFCQPYGTMGIPVHTRDFARSLNKVCDLTIVPIFPKPTNHQEASHDIEDLKVKFQRPAKEATSMVFWYPNTYWSLLGGWPKNIGYYIFEYTKIPPMFVEAINGLDVICTASEWGVRVLKENGVKVRCEVIHGGVSDKYSSNGKSLGSKFRFLHVGKAENRKGTEMLIKAFTRAFKGNKDVELTLSIDNPHIANFNAYELIKQYTDANNIRCIGHIKDIKDLYLTHHCAVFPSKAEGIGLPIVEAMGCGMPVIVCPNSGISEYADKKNAILLEKVQTVPVFDPHFFPNSGQYGVWDSPTEDELVEKMLWVYKNYEEAEKIGNYAEKWIKEYYNWDLAAKKFEKLI